MTKKFDRETMLDLLFDEKEVVSDVISGHSRWSVGHTLIFRAEGKLWRTTYSVGATESQEESPWEYERDGVECTEVMPIQKSVTIYEPVA